jgi:hypothetical protein
LDVEIDFGDSAITVIFYTGYLSLCMPQHDQARLLVQE